MNAETRSKPSHLYRHFSGDGALIYVGVSLSTVGRLCQHREHSRWFEDIAKVTIEKFPDRALALEAEKTAIRAEQPTWNVHHKKIPPAPPQKAFPLIEVARKEVTYRLVSIKPMYSIDEVATLFGVIKSVVRRLIENRELASIEVSSNRAGAKPLTRITGWQILDYLEHQSA